MAAVGGEGGGAGGAEMCGDPLWGGELGGAILRRYSLASSRPHNLPSSLHSRLHLLIHFSSFTFPA